MIDRHRRSIIYERAERAPYLATAEGLPLGKGEPEPNARPAAGRLGE
jgi:hypothetical protein